MNGSPRSPYDGPERRQPKTTVEPGPIVHPTLDSINVVAMSDLHFLVYQQWLHGNGLGLFPIPDSALYTETGEQLWPATYGVTPADGREPVMPRPFGTDADYRP